MAVTYTFTNGTTADADEVNQNFNDVVALQIKNTTFNDNTEYSAGGNTWTAVKTFTLSGLQSSSCLLMAEITCDLKRSGGTPPPDAIGQMTLSITPSGQDENRAGQPYSENSPPSWRKNAPNIIDESGTTYVTKNRCFTIAGAGATSYSIKVLLRGYNSGTTCYIRNTTIKIYYFDKSDAV